MISLFVFSYVLKMKPDSISQNILIYSSGVAPSLVGTQRKMPEISLLWYSGGNGVALSVQRKGYKNQRDLE